jgi:hypothetical protein
MGKLETIAMDRAAIDARAKEICETVAVETNSIAVFIGLKPKPAMFFADFATKLAEREADKAARLAAAPHGLVARLAEIDAMPPEPLGAWDSPRERERARIIRQIYFGE